MIAIIDYDIGNLGAVANMLHRIGARSEITCSADVLEQADKIILPGNGSFDACMQNLRDTGLIPLLQEKVQVDKVPLLGICVGAQMLGTSSEEGQESGLGWLDMKVKRFPSAPGFRIPHMGWSQISNRSADHPLTRDMEADARYYFVHSYYMEPKDPSQIVMSVDYGIEFCAAIGSDNIVGVQFHPEKSHRFGKRLLEAFVGGY